MKWYFKERQPDDIIRETHISEFFSDEELENESEPVVRESIQNALDARTNNQVHVRFYISNKSSNLSHDKWKDWFHGGWNHFIVEGNNLRRIPEEEADCRFLVCEDFGTSGLTGNIESWDEEDRDNNFMFFFRAEGRTGKGGSSGGRWGIGKHVFSRASRVNSFFGLTSRIKDPNEYLMGRSILKTHTLEGKKYRPDGTFGIRNSSAPLVLPITNMEYLESFKKDFRVTRNKEPGLSVVVPFINEKVSYEDLIYSVILGYFYPIVNRDLIIKVETEGKSTLIDNKNIKPIITQIQRENADELLKLIELAEFSQTCLIKDTIRIPRNNDPRLPWKDDFISEEEIEKIRSRLHLGQKIKFRISVLIQVEGEQDKFSNFDVVMEKEGQDARRPVFIRDGIIIKRVKIPRRTRGIRSLVIIEKDILATLLGDSEGPAHLEWQTKSGNLPEKYRNGKACIRYVSNCVENITRTLIKDDEEKDLNLLIDVFSLDANDIEPSPSIEVGEGEGEEPVVGKIKVSTNRNKQNHEIHWINSGFKVINGEKLVKIPSELEIKVAYMTSSGNPLCNYHTADFTLIKNPIEITNMKGLEILSVDKNHLCANIKETEFSISIKGFDTRRDLYVKVQVKGEENDTEV